MNYSLGYCDTIATTGAIVLAGKTNAELARSQWLADMGYTPSQQWAFNDEFPPVDLFDEESLARMAGGMKEYRADFPSPQAFHQYWANFKAVDSKVRKIFS